MGDHAAFLNNNRCVSGLTNPTSATRTEITKPSEIRDLPYARDDRKEDKKKVATNFSMQNRYGRGEWS